MDETEKISPVSAVGIESIKNRLRIKAIVEMLIEKEIFTEDELNEKIEKVRVENQDDYIKELTDQIKTD